jgi:hypothetical protein
VVKPPKAPSDGYGGLWGGFGSKPAPEAWTPGGDAEPAPKEPVPRRWRGLRLVRARRPRTRLSTALDLAMLALGLLAAVLLVWGLLAGNLRRF